MFRLLCVSRFVVRVRCQNSPLIMARWPDIALSLTTMVKVTLQNVWSIGFFCQFLSILHPPRGENDTANLTDMQLREWKQVIITTIGHIILFSAISVILYAKNKKDLSNPLLYLLGFRHSVEWPKRTAWLPWQHISRWRKLLWSRCNWLHSEQT